MNFLQLRERLTELHMDNSAEWIASQPKPKACVNDAYEYLFDILKNSEKIKKYLDLRKTKVTFSGKIGTLPADFDVIDKVYLSDFNSDSGIDGDLENRYYTFEVRGIRGSKKMLLQDDYAELWITYVPVRSDMSADGDEPLLPVELHKSLVDFSLVEYYRKIRDSIEASNSLNLAQSILAQKLKSL